MMISNKTTQKISTTRSNKKTVRRVQTEMDEPLPYRKTDLSNRDSQKHQSKPKYLDVYSKLNFKESSNGRKVYKMVNPKQLVANKIMRTEPDEPPRKPTSQALTAQGSKY